VFEHDRRQPFKLAHRQAVVGEMITAGYTNREIGERVGCSLRTVKRDASVVGAVRGGRRPRGRPRKSDTAATYLRATNVG
jgi:transposase